MEDKYKQWCENISKSHMGEKNSQYGVSVKERMKTEEGYKKFCQSCSRGLLDKNPNAKPIRMWNDVISLEFTSLEGAANYLRENGYTASKTAARNISTAIFQKNKYMGFYFEKI